MKNDTAFDAANLVELMFRSKPGSVEVRGIKYANEQEACRAMKLSQAGFRAYVTSRLLQSSRLRFRPRTIESMTLGEVIGRPALENSSAAVQAFLTGDRDDAAIAARVAADAKRVREQNNRSQARLGRPYSAPSLDDVLEFREAWSRDNATPYGWIEAAGRAFNVSRRTISRLVRRPEATISN